MSRVHRRDSAGGPGVAAPLLAVALVAAGLVAAQDPGAEDRLEADLRAWGARHEVDGLPISNVGDPDLAGVAFLYDVAIAAQTRVALGDLDSAGALLERVGRDWPRRGSDFVDSLKVREKIPFDQIDGLPRITNGPNLHLALSALSVWEARGRPDGPLMPMARSIAESIRGQVGPTGAVPYGPGGQRFPGGAAFASIFNPEYQINAYALFHRMAGATGGRAWQDAADEVLGWLVENRYDRRLAGFWSIDDQGNRTVPMDVPGWALSMIGPKALAARGVDVEDMIAALGRLPEGTAVTEWMVNRRNGLLIGADYLRTKGRAEPAARADADAERLRRILLALPLQRDGGGLAYAYRPGAGPDEPWSPAEGVPTGWGWNTQRGSSRIAGDYVLSSVLLGHDPVASAETRPTPRPAAADPPPAPRADPAASGPAPDEARSYRYQTAHDRFMRSRRLAIIGRMLSDPDYDLVTNGDHPPIVTERAGAAPRPGVPSHSSPFVALEWERRVLEGERVDVGGGLAFLSRGGRGAGPPSEGGFVVIDPRRDYRVVERLTRGGAQPRFNHENKFHHVRPEDGMIVAPSVNLIRLDLQTGQIKGAMPLRSRGIGLVFKRPLTPREVRRADTSGLLFPFEEDGLPYAWARDVNPETQLSVDARIFVGHLPRTAEEIDGLDRAMLGASLAGVQPGAYRDNVNLAARGYVDGMVFAPKPEKLRSNDRTFSYEPGWIYLRPRILGRRITSWTYLKRLAEQRSRTDDVERLSKHDAAVDEGRLILDWLADVEAVLSAGATTVVDKAIAPRLVEVVAQARENIWEGDDGTILLVVGRTACAKARSILAELKRRGGGGIEVERLKEAIAFAERQGLDVVEPRRSTYEVVLEKYEAHLARRKQEIHDKGPASLEERDPLRRAELAIERDHLRGRFAREVETMSFRDASGFYAIVPGVRESEARLALVEKIEEIDPERRIARTFDETDQSYLRAIIDREDEMFKPSLVERNLQYQAVYGEGRRPPLIEVSSGGGRLTAYYLLDFAGERIGRLEGNVRVDGKVNQGPVGPLSPTSTIHAERYAHIRYDDQNRPVGEVVFPIGKLGGLKIEDLANRLEEISVSTNPALRPIVETKVDPDREHEVETTLAGGRLRFVERWGQLDGDRILEERDYGSGNRERYGEHVFDPDLGKWVPRIVEVEIDGRPHERRTLTNIDSEGRVTYRVESVVNVSPAWARLIPAAVRPAVVRLIPRVAGLEVKSHETRLDELLYCRDRITTDGVGERTYFALEDEQKIFAATHQVVELASHTVLATKPYPAPASDETPIMLYKPDYELPESGELGDLAVYELNLGSHYEREPEGPPLPGPIVELMNDPRARPPAPRMNYRWARRIYELGAPGLRNQRSETLSELTEVEVEDEAGITLFDRQLEPVGDVGPRTAKRASRTYLRKRADGRYYVVPDAKGPPVASPAESRDVPTGRRRRFPADADALRQRAIAPSIGEALLLLDEQDLLPVEIRDREKHVVRFLLEDLHNRPERRIEFVTSDSLDRPSGHVVHVVDPWNWYWHPRHRQWYAAVSNRYGDGVLDQRRSLARNADGSPRIDPIDGRATYLVETFTRWPDPFKVGLDVALSILEQPSGESFEEVIARDGTPLERRLPGTAGGIGVFMNAERARDEFAMGYPEREIPLRIEALDREGKPTGRVLARCESESDGVFESRMTIRSTTRGDWRTIEAEFSATGVRDAFGYWSHWRTWRETVGIDVGGESVTTRVVEHFPGDLKASDTASTGERDPADLRFFQEKIKSPLVLAARRASKETLGRAVYDVAEDKSKRLVVRELAAGLAIERRPGVPLRPLQHSIAYWPDCEPIELWTDALGREHLARARTSEQVALAHVFDHPTLDWVVGGATVFEPIPPTYLVAAHRREPGAPAPPVQHVSLVGSEPASHFYPDGPALIGRLTIVREEPDHRLADPKRQRSTAHRDGLGRTWLEARAIEAGSGVVVSWLTYTPQLAARAFTPAVHRQELWERAVRPSLENVDFLVFFAKKGKAADVVGVDAFEGNRKLVRFRPPGRGGDESLWRPDFDDPIVLRSTDGSGHRIVGVRPMNGRAPLWAAGDHPRCIVLPLDSLRRRGFDLTKLSLRLDTNEPVRVTRLERLTDPRRIGEWIEDVEARESLFPKGEPIPGVVDREPAIRLHGRGLVTVFRGSGSGASVSFYDHGRLVSMTRRMRNGTEFDEIRTAYPDVATPFLRVPQQVESSFGGWLSRMVTAVETTEGRLLIEAQQSDRPRIAALLPHGGVEATASGALRGGSSPATAYLPLGVYDPASPFPRGNASIVNLLARRAGWSETSLDRAVGESPLASTVGGVSPIEYARRLDALPLNVPFSWADHDPPPAGDGGKGWSRPSPAGWAARIARLAEAAPTGLPETSPGTPRAAYAETHQVARIVLGLIRARRGDPASVGRTGDPLTTARLILAFYRGATHEGRAPALSAYRVDTGAPHAYADEWKAPSIAAPVARANVALARASLEVARASGKADDLRFALALAERALEFQSPDPLLGGEGSSDAGRATLRPAAVARARQLLEAVPVDGRTNRRGDDHALEIADLLLATREDIQLQRRSPDVAIEGLGRAIAAVVRADEPTRRLLSASLHAEGGFCEHPPEEPVPLRGLGLRLIPRAKSFDLSSNTEALLLLDSLATFLDRGGEASLLDRSRLARGRLRAWFREVVLPEVDRHSGLAPSRWTTYVDSADASDGASPLALVVPNRWPTLGASLASARAALILGQSHEKVAAWLENCRRVFGVEGPSGDSGLDYAPLSFGRYEGPLLSAELTAEFGELSQHAGDAEGVKFAEQGLSAFAGDDREILTESLLHKANGAFAGVPIATGDGRVVYVGSKAAWSPVATLVASQSAWPLGPDPPDRPTPPRPNSPRPLPWSTGGLVLIGLVGLARLFRFRRST